MPLFQWGGHLLEVLRLSVNRTNVNKNVTLKSIVRIDRRAGGIDPHRRGGAVWGGNVPSPRGWPGKGAVPPPWSKSFEISSKNCGFMYFYCEKRKTTCGQKPGRNGG